MDNQIINQLRRGIEATQCILYATEGCVCCKRWIALIEKIVESAKSEPPPAGELICCTCGASVCKKCGACLTEHNEDPVNNCPNKPIHKTTAKCDRLDAQQLEKEQLILDNDALRLEINIIKGENKALAERIEKLEAENKKLRDAIKHVPLQEYNDALRNGCDHVGAWACFCEAVLDWEKEALKLEIDHIEAFTEIADEPERHNMQMTKLRLEQAFQEGEKPCTQQE